MGKSSLKIASRILLYFDMCLILALIVSAILMLGLQNDALLPLTVVLLVLTGPVSSVTAFLTGARIALANRDTTLGCIVVFSLLALFACFIAFAIICMVNNEVHGYAAYFITDQLVVLGLLGSYLYALAMALVILCRRARSC